MRKTSRTPTSAAALAVMALAAGCGKPAPAPSPATLGALDAELQGPTAAGGQTIYPVVLRNSGAGPLAGASVSCRFSTTDGRLLYAGDVTAEALAPGQSVTRTIAMPTSIARQIRALRCRPTAH